MKITKLQDNFYMYHIPTYDENKLGVNIYVLLNGKEALLIDSGYKKDCEQVLEDLKSKSIKVSSVIPSHYHPDHVEGLYFIDKPKVYGNQYAVETLKRFYDNDDLLILSPTTIIDNKYKLNFGQFELAFSHAPGHSNCSMLININNSYLHVGDLYIKTDDNKEVLPYVMWQDVCNHIESLDKILLYSDKTFLLSHGTCPCDYDEIEQGIKNRQLYLKALLSSDNKISTKDAVKNCTKPFEFMKWRACVK